MKYVYEQTIGHKRITGTDHPVRAVVYRNGPREWIASVICNGIATMAAQFRTRREAIAWHEGKKGGPRQ